MLWQVLAGMSITSDGVKGPTKRGARKIFGVPPGARTSLI
jgi:hypothetical protein